MNTILFIYIIYAVFVFLVTMKDFGKIEITPKQIYECNHMNMFGCVVLFVGLIIINPLFYMAHFVYWIFHVGRKD